MTFVVYKDAKRVEEAVGECLAAQASWMRARSQSKRVSASFCSTMPKHHDLDEVA